MSQSRAMNGPDKRADVSRAGKGEIADTPDDVFDLAVDNIDGDTVGYVHKWDTAEWIFAETAATRWIHRQRPNEYHGEG